LAQFKKGVNLIMWKRFKKAGFFASIGAILFVILKIILKNSYFASIIYRWFD